jgi:NAD(P)-dependent dehydrogenase (short-subunit alcohol dehydrogenase family)
MSDFSNRTVVVTGGTGALGSAVVDVLLKAGARCVVPYRDEHDAGNFAHRDHKQVSLVAVKDLSDEGDVAKLYNGIAPLWASIHIAGGYLWAPIGDTDKAALLKQLDMNVVSAFLCCRAAIKAMGGNGGRIVNVAARQALEWRLGASQSAYGASKAAVAAMTAALAEEVAKDGILVNAVAPSIMDTAVNRKDMPKADFDKWPKVEEVAQTILFLASPDNRVTRGAIVPVYGKSS